MSMVPFLVVLIMYKWLLMIIIHEFAGPLYWPMFVVSTLAATIASQAMISGTFSIVHQSLSLGCFPRVKVVYTSANHEGQVYIPAINYILMLACIGVTAGFKSTVKIGNAYGNHFNNSAFYALISSQFTMLMNFHYSFSMLLQELL